ncbi:hypothetical protein CHLRE_06g263100v5 [Chlamydomonas reinhardtii]|uniref:SprT-like domain-containing protein n=1 Tax=Chlamydomonas reinhardtii TaxID=3055 RepID=A0A2K3DMV0_CHLRE|nr:uncharacterized protein CHLRE_06g263100v5 [Chlamydomonas reinhardtii]PNW81850.1 hypothetical protein CHLRE_06g263100v5 [Chlamydomonas reinhardtii]
MDEFEELGDEFPDIHGLFLYYNDLYFGGVLLSNTTVAWSSARMTSCGGTCRYHPQAGCEIRLSEPLLKLRPVRDMKMVLLHEMIHAHNMTLKIYDPDPGGHGPPFKALMDKINKSTVPDPQRPPGGYNITTTHSMHGEVNNYRTHHWECDRCKKLIRRSMNRPPQEADCFGIRTRGPTGAACRDPNCAYHVHIRTCGGTFVKVKEPEKPPKHKPQKQSASASASAGLAGAAGAAGGSGAGKKKASSVPPVLPPGQRSIDSMLGLKRPAVGSASPESPGSPRPRIAAGGAAAAATSTCDAVAGAGADTGAGAAGGKGRVSTSAAADGTAGMAARGGPASRGAAGGGGQGSRPGSTLGSASEAPEAQGGAAAAAAAAATGGVPPPDAPDPTPMSADELRRRCAEAALARFGGGYRADGGGSGKGGGSGGSAGPLGPRPPLQAVAGSAAAAPSGGGTGTYTGPTASGLPPQGRSHAEQDSNLGPGHDAAGKAGRTSTSGVAPSPGAPSLSGSAAAPAHAAAPATVPAAKAAPQPQAPPWPPDVDVLLVDDSDDEDGVDGGAQQEQEQEHGEAQLEGDRVAGHGGPQGSGGDAEIIDLVDSDDD